MYLAAEFQMADQIEYERRIFLLFFFLRNLSAVGGRRPSVGKSSYFGLRNSFKRYFWSVCFIRGPVLGTGGTTVNNNETTTKRSRFFFLRIICPGGGHIHNWIIHAVHHVLLSHPSRTWLDVLVL